MPGAVIAEVARRYGISANTLYGWRSEARKSTENRVESVFLRENSSNFVELEVSAAENPEPGYEPEPKSEKPQSEARSASRVSKISVEFEHCNLSISGKIGVPVLSQILTILEASC